MDIKIIYLDMPSRIKGFVLKHDTASYTIVINPKLTHDQQKAVYLHELSHIINDDFECDDIDMLEYVRHY